MRLNKFIASSGICSRRAADRHINGGRITLNGTPCDNPATQVDKGDTVRFDGKAIVPRLVQTLLLNKPRGLVCTKSDEFERPTIYSILPPKYRHLNHVGRLDRDSGGLLILSNDGSLAQRLTHPSRHIEKEYHVTVQEAFPNKDITSLLQGVPTPEGRAKAKSVRRLSARRLSIVLETGLKRQIRHMLEALHLKVSRLVRVRIGGLTAPGLSPGKHRLLTSADLKALLSSPTSSGRLLRISK